MCLLLNFGTPQLDIKRYTHPNMTKERQVARFYLCKSVRICGALVLGCTNLNLLRYEADAKVATGAVRSNIPEHVMEALGLMSRGNWVAEYADGRTEVVAVTEPIVFAVMGRDTLKAALVQGDEVLIGQTVLEKLRVAGP